MRVGHSLLSIIHLPIIINLGMGAIKSFLMPCGEITHLRSVQVFKSTFAKLGMKSFVFYSEKAYFWWVHATFGFCSNFNTVCSPNNHLVRKLLFPFKFWNFLDVIHPTIACQLLCTTKYLILRFSKLHCHTIFNVSFFAGKSAHHCSLFLIAI